MADLLDPFCFLEVVDQPGFDRLFDRVRDHQRRTNPVYQRYLLEQGDDPLPYLPVEAFKRADVCCFPSAEAQVVFESSATGGTPSRHLLPSAAPYDSAVLHGFDRVFGEGPYRLVAVAPGYRDNPRSSLLHMLRLLIERRGDAQSGFVTNRDEMWSALAAGRDEHRAMVFGAAFGLVDLLESGPLRLPAGATVVETGGMKTHRREMDRETLHGFLADRFCVPQDRVYSEYGMCELLSQAYTRGDRAFFPPPWMRFDVLDPNNPYRRVEPGAEGRLAVVDLANVHSAAAVLTSDRARRLASGGVDIIGRLSGAELRGCNFLIDRIG